MWFTDLYLRGICISISYGGVEIPKYRGILLNFPIPRTWNLQITHTVSKFIKFLYWLQTICAKNTEIPTILYAPFLLYFLAAFFNMWTELYDIY